MVRASDEMGAALAVASRPGLIRRGRRRLAAHATVPRSVLTRLYVDSAEIRALRRDLVRQERERAAREEAPSELELHELRALARRRRYVLTAVLLLTAGAGLLALGGTLASRGLTGGALPSLDTAPGRLWEAAWSTWAASGDGYDSPLSPFLAVLALPVALGRVVGLDGPLMLHALVLVAVPLGALGAWAAAGTVTRRTHLRAWVALTWALAPAGLLALGQGRLGPLLVHVLLPWALTALMRGLGADRRDVVLSGMVGAHHLTDSERAELDRLSPPADLPRQGAAGAQGTGAQGADADGLRGTESDVEAGDVEPDVEAGDGAEEAAEDGGGLGGAGTVEATTGARTTWTRRRPRPSPGTRTRSARRQLAPSPLALGPLGPPSPLALSRLSPPSPPAPTPPSPAPGRTPGGTRRTTRIPPRRRTSPPASAPWPVPPPYGPPPPSSTGPAPRAPPPWPGSWGPGSWPPCQPPPSCCCQPWSCSWCACPDEPGA